ncbi:hypothetical protein [Shimazuella alba]|uniref:Uncharacterized protein n=1 Tax=Shimazuella alba TaxID=2690964 RepID=A0A6I4VQU7_9BACL|nr:hypothetical protein [Shimazuella alba]MXQ54027.1 hypothetical protein [Shimazuella alba]
MEIECYICADFGWKSCPECEGGGVMYVELPEMEMEQEGEFLKALYGEDCVIG